MLSDEMIAEIGEACGLGCKAADAGYPCDMLWFDGNPTPFARAIEAEVRKQDTALIRQLVEALGAAKPVHADSRNTPAVRTGQAMSGYVKHYIVPTHVVNSLLTATRARLEAKP